MLAFTVTAAVTGMVMATAMVMADITVAIMAVATVVDIITNRL
jgi:hypothetical protein